MRRRAGVSGTRRGGGRTKAGIHGAKESFVVAVFIPPRIRYFLPSPLHRAPLVAVAARTIAKNPHTFASTFSGGVVLLHAATASRGAHRQRSPAPDDPLGHRPDGCGGEVRRARGSRAPRAVRLVRSALVGVGAASARGTSTRLGRAGNSRHHGVRPSSIPTGS